MNRGNFCITGHNYTNVFGKLRTLQIGDTFYIVSKDGRKITYTIQELIPKVSITDMSHIEQNNDGIRKVTLITCDPGNATRFIVKAKYVSSNLDATNTTNNVNVAE